MLSCRLACVQCQQCMSSRVACWSTISTDYTRRASSASAFRRRWISSSTRATRKCRRPLTNSTPSWPCRTRTSRIPSSTSMLQGVCCIRHTGTRSFTRTRPLKTTTGRSRAPLTFSSTTETVSGTTATSSCTSRRSERARCQALACWGASATAKPTSSTARTTRAGPCSCTMSRSSTRRGVWCTRSATPQAARSSSSTARSERRAREALLRASARPSSRVLAPARSRAQPEPTLAVCFGFIMNSKSEES
mmetsp:Transcript_28658/g.67918  ORF Transcript_28658/g.67918 Transcript_28658/m.67918 type:complete len:249 (+) Transcript_28658:705-1451(+)